MIVKNEAAIIERCCASFAGWIDTYVICDTGSDDNTVELIERVFGQAGIEGTIVHTTFENFEQARNEALVAAQQSAAAFDYILFCDADMELVVDDVSWREQLNEPAYTVVQRSINGVVYPNLRLVRKDHPARYVGVTHEFLDIGGAGRPLLDGIHFVDHASGSNRVAKYDRDIQLLTNALQHQPENSRYVFYLANSYFDSDRTEAALHWYRRRLTMGGYEDERFISSYRIGLCFQRLNDDPLLFHQMMLTFDRYPTRAEPLHVIALRSQRLKNHRLAYELARIGAELAAPKGALFVEADVYEWRLDDIMAVSLYWLGRYAEAIALNRELLETAPTAERARISANLELCLGKAG
jgi:tetratricopeptide (TPR) repeat protein